MRQLRLFFTALEYFTRWPKPGWVGFDASWLAPSTRYMPLVGALVGLVGAAVYGVAAWCWTPAVAVGLSMAATVFATGAFHEDGFADVCDGLGGAVGRERALEIMTDSRIGAYGAVGIVLMLLLKFASLSGLAVAAGAVALVCGHAVSRVVPLLLMTSLPYAKPLAGSKAKPVAHGVGRLELGAGLALALAVLAAAGMLAPASGVTPAGLAFAGAVALASALPLRAWFRRRLQGYTGDCLGAAQQVAEVVFYLALGGWLGHR